VALIRTEVADGVAVVTLDDPGRRNAMSTAMAAEIGRTFDRLEAMDGVGAIVVTGSPPSFCAGADLLELETVDRAGLERIYAGFLRVSRCPLPTVAAVNGAAVGAGVNLALVCDLRVMASSGRIDCRFLSIGLHPGGGHAWMLRRLVGAEAAAAMLLFGEVLDADAAVRLGLAWSAVEDGAVVDEARRLAGRVVSAPPELVRRLKATLRAADGVADHDTAVARELEDQLWSAGRPEFRERLEALRRRVSRKRSG
jgi:enoyl-CoA hydratase